MKISYRGHHYKSQFKAKLTVGYCKWFSHEDDCCDYWTPITDPKAQRALIMDDELGFAQPTEKDS